MNAKTWLVLGASLGVLGVAAGTFGAHALPDYLHAAGADSELAKRLDWWETGVRYQMYHALALLAVAWVADQKKSFLPVLAGVPMFLGTLVFSGCLYALAMTGMRWLGMIVPIGGVLFMVGWVFLALAGGGLVAESPEKKMTAREKLLAEEKLPTEAEESIDVNPTESPPG